MYSEILPDETKETALAFMRQATATFAAQGVKIQRVITENGASYRSRAFCTATDRGWRHHGAHTAFKGASPAGRATNQPG